MIKELVNFSESLTEEFKGFGKTPKEGLHILLEVDEDGNIITTDNKIEFGFYSKKMESLSPFLGKCIQLQENAWIIDTFKTFDSPAKAIHTAQPFSIGFKREYLKGGKKFENNLAQNKSQVFERFENYFEKAAEFLPAEEESLKKEAEAFHSFFTQGTWKVILDNIENQRSTKYALKSNHLEQLKGKLKETKDKNEKESLKDDIKAVELEALEFQPLSDSDYIIFYLDLPIDTYKITHGKYLDDKLFNTAEYNTEPNENGVLYGTSNFMNTFNQKMPFLLHQSATFDITGRISNIEAKALYEFEKVLTNKTLPNPLPIFIYRNEMFQEKVIGLYKDGKRKFREIVNELYDLYQRDFQNYYLLNWSNTKDGIVFNDFDFVSKFEFKLNDPHGLIIENLFNLYGKKGEDKKVNVLKYYAPLVNIFQLEDLILKPLIQNKYLRVDYFSDFKKEDYERMDMTFLSFSKYRRSIYDFVYKSKRNVIGGKEFDELVFNSIKDDFKKDNEYGIKEKLNYWYSLYNYFHKPKNNINMASKLKEYQDFVSDLINETADLNQANDEYFAFASGQVIYYLLRKSRAKDKNVSFRLMESYLQKSTCKTLKENICEDFDRYKHEYFSDKFKKVSAFVFSYDTEQNMKKLQPQLLSGLFAKNALSGETNGDSDESNEEN